MRKTAKEFFIFPWSIAKSGYQWIETTRVHPFHPVREANALFLSTGRPIGERSPHISYQPLTEHSGLFLTFAWLDHTQHESLLGFANRYGPLGEFVSIALPVSNQWGDGEPYDIWFDEITRMRLAVDLWDMLRSHDLKGLAKVIRWTRKDIVVYKTDKMVAQIATPFLRPELLKRVQPGKVVMPAWYHLGDVINERLSGRVSPLLFVERQQEKSPGGPLDLYFTPASLIGALWLQFAQAVAQNRVYRQCQYCGKPFILAPGIARTNRRNCSDSCKTSASRKRNEGKKPRPRRKARAKAA